MTKRKVYISSTYRDLSPIRDKIIKLVTDQNVLGDYYDVAYIMENMKIAGNPDNALDQCLAQVDEADVYILIIGSWYGSLTTFDNKEQSYTQHEFDQAIKSSRKKRIYILHSTNEFDTSATVAENVRKLCVEKKITLEENELLLKKFKDCSTSNRSSALYFNSESSLLDEINKCFIGDIAYYYLKETLSNSLGIEPKLKYKIDRFTENTKLVDGMRAQMGQQKNVFKIVVFSKPDDRPEYYSKRILLEKCGAQNPDYIDSFRSSGYMNNLLRFNEEYTLNQCIELLKSNDNFDINHQISEFSKAVDEKRKDFMDLYYFEVSEIELSGGNKWIEFINHFCGKLNSYYKELELEHRIFIFININYKKPESLNCHSYFNTNNYIDIGSLGKINTSDLLLFFKKEVLKINDDDDSEREIDKLEQFKKFEVGINKIRLENHFTYYSIEKYLF